MRSLHPWVSPTLVPSAHLWVLVGHFGKVLDTCCHLCPVLPPSLWALGGHKPPVR